MKGRSASPANAAAESTSRKVRLDKWLWAARFYKTRSLAMEAIHKGQVDLAGHTAKPGREVAVGDSITLRDAGGLWRTVAVLGVSDVRGPAPQAQALYAETAESIAAREAQQQLRRLGVEPALAQQAGRPTKRDRRELVEWERWSASWPEASDPR